MLAALRRWPFGPSQLDRLLHKAERQKRQIRQQDQAKTEKGKSMIVEDLEHSFEQLEQRIDLVRSYL